MPNWLALLIGLGFIGAVLLLALRNKGPQEKPVEPEPPELPSKPCIEFHGISIRPQAFPAEFDPAKFPAFHYPLGTALCFEALVTDCDPFDWLKVANFRWSVHQVGTGLVQSEVTLTPRLCWSGEGIGACCGQTAPVPMVVRCVAELSNGDLLEAKREFWVIPQRGWK